MIGVFDSGIGGLTVLDALRRRIPAGDFLYVSDSARLPYGNRSAAEICSIGNEIATYLCDEGAEGIVVACNTVSAVALPQLRLACPVPVWGMVDAGVDAATRGASGPRVAVIGTEATIASGVFQRKLEQRGRRVWAQACPSLASAIEEGSPDAEVLIRHYLKEMPRVDTLLLACTHYPLLRATFEKIAGPRVRVVDGADLLAAKVAAQIGSADLLVCSPTTARLRLIQQSSLSCSPAPTTPCSVRPSRRSPAQESAS
jgi:glutamate racemase